MISISKIKYKGYSAEFIPNLIRDLFEIGADVSFRLRHKKWRTHNLKNSRLSGAKLYNNLNNLKYRGLIVKDNDGYYKFTDAGLRWSQKTVKKYFKPVRPKWDKKWRLVIFDIPKELHAQRVRFSEKLKTMGFFTLQKSVFIYPYDCYAEISEIGGKSQTTSIY